HTCVVLPPLGEAGAEPAQQVTAAAEGLTEGDRARDRAVVEEDGKGKVGREANDVRSRWIEARAGRVQPLAASGADPPALVRRKHGEPDAFVVQRLQRAQVCGRLRPATPLRV